MKTRLFIARQTYKLQERDRNKGRRATSLVESESRDSRETAVSTVINGRGTNKHRQTNRQTDTYVEQVIIIITTMGF